jgi:hypothetical protein
MIRGVAVVHGTLLSQPLMNILIENSEMPEYPTNFGQWTKNAVEGKNFAATAVAFQAAKNESIGKFNIVCHIRGTNQLIKMDYGRGKGLIGASAE